MGSESSSIRNVVVSAFLFPNSAPGRLVFWSGNRLIPLLSAALVGELIIVLDRTKLDSYVGREHRMALLATYVSRSELIDVDIRIEACRDPRDNHVLELAVSSRADAIVTGDQDLLELDPFEGIPIVRPADFNL
ncbi:MAG: putative toxin-antitoxin system toxin component, PIN family [Fimbriimonadales bacterium]